MAYQSRRQPEVDANLIRLSILGPVVLSTGTALIAFNDAFDLEVIYEYLRITGWGMLVTFLCNFSASPMLHFFPSRPTRWLLINRKYFGLGFAVFMAFHLYGLYLKMICDPIFFFQETTIPEFTLGIIGIYFALSMCFTSTADMQKYIGHRWWKTLHAWGGHFILFGFWITYLDHGMDQLPIFLVINGLIILRCLRRLQAITKETPHAMVNVAVTAGLGLLLCSVGLYAYELWEDRPGPAIKRDVLYAVQDYFPIPPGSAWTYRVSSGQQTPVLRTYRSEPDETARDRRTVRIQIADDSYQTIGYDSYGVRIYEQTTPVEKLLHDPPGIFLPHLYLYEKKSFSTGLVKHQGANRPAENLDYYSEFRLAARETVRLDSGEEYPDCLRIEYVRKIGPPEGLQRVTQGQLWLAKQVGRVKESQTIRYLDPSGVIIKERQELLELVDVKMGKW